MTDRWVVKNRVTQRLHDISDSQEEAVERAAALNSNYQSDEYYVEKFDTKKNRWFPNGN